MGKLSSILCKHMSILFVINSCTAPISFLKEFTLSASIVTFLAFCNLCAVTDGKTSFSALSSAELFLLSDLILSTVRLTGLSVLEIFALKTKFFLKDSPMSWIWSAWYVIAQNNHQSFWTAKSIETVFRWRFDLIL